MRLKLMVGVTCVLLGALSSAQRAGVPTQAPARPADPVKTLADRLDLERYKATIKALTQFGDRLEGTDRNRAAVDWIEQQLKLYGCTNTERLKYMYPPPRQATAGSPVARGATGPLGAITRRGPRGGIIGANSDPARQPDARLRALNAQPTTPGPPTPGPREEVYCTKVGTTRPDEMYIIGAHMDGRGFGEAANDDGSGTAIVMELARVFSNPDVQTERTIRFVLWNSEELGFVGADAYIRERRDLQGKENPPGSGRYPEPKWLGMIQHDMMLFDHGMPLADGSLGREQRPEADVNIEFQENSTFAAESHALARRLQQANERYATDYPAAIGGHMAATDSNAFQNVVAAVSLRENESTVQINNGWDPHHHQPTDIYANFSDKDFRLGLNAAQTTLGAVAQLTGASLIR